MREARGGTYPHFRAVAVASSLAFAGLLLQGAALGGALYVRDISLVWLPQAEAFVHCAGQGSVPLWDPYSGFGRPLLADPRAEVLYPLTWLNLLVGPATYYAVFAIGHVALAGLGAALVGRRFGLSRVGALTAGGVYMAGGPLLSLVAMWAHLAGCAFMPWVAWACLRVQEAPTRRRVAAAASLIALQVFAGSPEMVALTGLAVVIVIGFPPRPVPAAGRGRRVAALGACALLGLALSAAQWVPTLDVVRRSQRWNLDRQAALAWSLHPAALVEMALPARWAEQVLTAAGGARVLEDREPWLRSIYLGMVTVV
ncbi:MAG TPA: hypothetical protein VFQ51_14980, partial [Vicinamibacteria bacterium]|nr:hypothetical protein [Vicinamibacteria bacterium]